jgi:hypothetical protein
MAKAKKFGSIVLVGLCIGATTSAFAGGAAGVRFASCNHPGPELAAKADRLEAKIAEKTAAGQSTAGFESQLAAIEEALAGTSC